MAPQRTTPHKQQQRQDVADSSAAGPATRTRAAMLQQQHQQQQDAAEMVLPLLLQHDSIRTHLRLVCSLLCCSKAVAAAVAEHCAGQLDIQLQWTAAWPRDQQEQVKEAHQKAPWLHKHAQLARLLDLQIDSGIVQPHPLKVGSIAATLSLLEQLPARFLTRLGLRLWPVHRQDLPAFAARASAALGRLTALRTLGLDWQSGPPADGVPVPALPGLAALTQLTFLRHSGPLEDLQHVPPQLLELDLQGRQELPELSRLTALTALTCTEMEQGDVLPANLQALDVGIFRSVQPLLPLQQLRQLAAAIPSWEDGWADITADQLRQLSSLSAFSLLYSSVGIQPASAGAWPLLPLERLELETVSLSAAGCQSMAQLSSLTSLELTWCELPLGASAQELAAALRQLSGLQQLQLQHLKWRSCESITEQQLAEGMQLMQAVGGLQQLRDLDISHSPQLAAVHDSLAAMTGLTWLSLHCSGSSLPDAALAAIVSELPRLQHLDCGGNWKLADAGLSAIGRLQQLTGLVLICTLVGDSALQHLTDLVQLKKLDLAWTRVTDAGLQHLCGVTQLQALRLPDRVSVQQWRWLRQQLPDLTFW